MKQVNSTAKNFFLIGLMMAFLAVVQVSAAGARQRPFSDWLNVQDTAFNPNTCAGINLVWFPQDFSRQAYVDLSGKAGNCIQNTKNGPAINTQIDGTVKERDLADGTAEITVNIHFTNSLAFVRDFEQSGAPFIFGYSRAALFNHPELTPGLANGNLVVKFIIAHPGDPLTDLPFTRFTFIRFGANASGPLRAAFGEGEGTSGRMLITQTGVVSVPGQGNGVADGFTAELVNVFKAGN